MTIKTPLCDFLGVKYPIMLAGMGGVSYAELAAAMSNAGGYGVLGMAGTTPDFIESQMKRVRELTDKPFGVDLLAASPESLEESVDVIINNGADSFVAGLGVPMPIMERLKKAGVKVMVVGGAVKHAIKDEQAGCDAVILLLPRSPFEARLHIRRLLPPLSETQCARSSWLMLRRWRGRVGR